MTRQEQKEGYQKLVDILSEVDSLLKKNGAKLSSTTKIIPDDYHIYAEVTIYFQAAPVPPLP
jgi:hypothetical protein